MRKRIFRETLYVMAGKENFKIIADCINVNNSKEKVGETYKETYKGMAAIRCSLIGPDIEE